MKHAFTVDVEDWYHGIPVEDSYKNRAPRRLELGLLRLLDLMDQFRVRGTFFVLGPIAEERPDLVKEIARRGHEVGCHGWSHELIYRMSPERFRAETRRARDAIADVLGEPPRAYRAAYFSITKSSWWALSILAELGFDTDSSIFPVRNWRYGIPGFSRDPLSIETDHGNIVEIPLGTRRIGALDMPVTGGAYLRIYPYAITKANLKAIERQGRPHVFYVHPWELDPRHPRVPFHWKARVTHYVNLGSTVPKLTRLLEDFAFGSLREVFPDEFSVARTATL